MKQDIVDALIKRIREDYSRLDMRAFRTQTSEKHTLLSLTQTEDCIRLNMQSSFGIPVNNNLGCAGCLGGNAIALRDPAFMDLVHFPFTPQTGLLEKAAEIMGLSIEAAEELLFPSRWPTKRRNLLLKLSPGTREYGEACIRALQTFVENGDQWPHRKKETT